MTRTWEASSHGVDWALTLETDRLMPGRLTDGTIAVTARGTFEARGLVVALVAVEHWQHDETTTDGRGNTSTRTVTSTDELRREPVERQIGGQPWRIGEAAKGRQAVTQIRREKTWRGENHEVRDVVGFAGRHAQFAALARDAMHHGAGAHVASQLFE